MFQELKFALKIPFFSYLPPFAITVISDVVMELEGKVG